MFEATNNVSRETFNYVRDNLFCTKKEVVDQLSKKGYKKSSVSSLLGQMLKQNLIEQKNDELFTKHKEYVPLKATRYYKPTGKRKSKVVSQSVKQEWEPAPLLQTLSIVQAKALYDELKVIFGA